VDSQTFFRLGQKRFTVLPHEEQFALVARAKTGDLEAQNILVESNMRLVFAEANRYRRHTALDFDELVAEGTIGIIESIDRFKPARGAVFLRAAGYGIRCRMLRAIAEAKSPFGGSILDRMRVSTGRYRHDVADARRRGLDDTEVERELATKYKRTPKTIRAMQLLTQQPLAFDALVSTVMVGARIKVGDTMVDDQPSTDERIEDGDLEACVKKAIAIVRSQADERSRVIMDLRLFAAEPRFREEVGVLVGLSGQGVSNIEKRIIERVRAIINRYLDIHSSCDGAPRPTDPGEFSAPLHHGEYLRPHRWSAHPGQPWPYGVVVGSEAVLYATCADERLFEAPR